MIPQGSVGYVACSPLFFELALMTSHPLPEVFNSFLWQNHVWLETVPILQGLVGAFLSGLNTSTYVVFLLVMMVPNIGHGWTTYVLVL